MEKTDTFSSPPHNIHATSLEKDGEAILLLGAPGAGKSDLALRLLDRGWALISDDRTDLIRRSTRVYACTAPNLAGLLEIRGVGIVTVPRTDQAQPVCLAVDLVPPDTVERLPEPEERFFLGVPVPLFRLCAFEASAALKVERAHDLVLGKGNRW